MKVESHDPDFEVIVSVPAKCVLSGEISTLFPTSLGLALSLDAKFYAEIKKSNRKNVKILNPQFPSSDFEYMTRSCFPQDLYIDSCFSHLSRYLELEDREFSKFEVTLFMNPAFFSESKIDLSRYYVSSFFPEHFPHFDAPLFDCQTTGLGSSACLVVSIVLGVLTFLRSRLTEENEVFWLSWLVTRSVEKYSTGFDVSSAVFGSQVFSSFQANEFEAKKNLFWNDLKEFKRQISSFKGPERKLNFSFDDFSAIFFDLNKGAKSKSYAETIFTHFCKKQSEKESLLKEMNEIAIQLSQVLKSNTFVLTDQTLNRNHLKILSTLPGDSKASMHPFTLTQLFNQILDKFENCVWYVISPGEKARESFVILTKYYGKDLRNARDDILSFVQEYFKKEKEIVKVSSFVCKVL